MKRKALGWALFAAAMLAFAASAGAVDGTIEINQAVVTANDGVFPYVISAGGSYRLTGNLTVSSTSVDAIDVNANVNHVTIDLNGFSITGPGGGGATGNGIYGPNAGALTVENGTVTGFSGNAGVYTGNNGIVKSVHADSNGEGVITGNNSVIQGCTANGNSFGIESYGGGAVISGNSANSNSGTGIDCGGSGCAISNNTSDNNGLFGIEASDGTTGYGGNVLTGNFVTNVTGGTSMGNNICGGKVC